MTIIDMSRMPPPDAISPVSFQARLDNLLALYTAGMRAQLNDDTFPVPLVSDPAYQILSTVALALGLKDQGTNEAVRANMLAYAQGNDLAHLGANVGVERIVVQAADDTVSPPLEEILEDQERFRLRIQMAPESWTTAGSRGSYEFHTLSADARVVDVFVDKPTFERVPWDTLGIEQPRPNMLVLECTYDARLPEPLPGDVGVTVLPEYGADAPAIMASVETALDPDTVIPFTDTRHVQQHEEITYAVVATLYFYPGPSVEPAIAEAEEKLWEYATAHYKLGHDIAVSGLHSAAHRNGCQRVELNITEDIVVQPWQAARCTGVTVLAGGRDV